MDKRFFTVKQAAAKTGLSRAHLYNEKTRGRLTMRKSGGRTVILVEDLEKWIAGFAVVQTKRAA